MTFFNDSQVEALVSAESVVASVLFKVDLATETLRLCEGASFTDNNGDSWMGFQSGVIEYDQIEYRPGTLARKRTYKINANDIPAAISMVGQEAEYRWRKITQLVQFFAVDGSMMPVGSPVVQDVSLMDRLIFSMRPVGTAVLTLDCETPFVKKNRTSFGIYTDADQRHRHPGDLGMERVKALSLGEVIKWPDF